MIKAVLDTVIFVRSLISPRSRWGRVVFDRAGDFRLFLSRDVLAEIVEVVQRPALTRKFRPLTGRELERLFALLGQAEVIELGDIPAVSRDPKDDKFLATAVLAGADYLVSEDEDLLVLGEYEGVTIVNAATFLRILEEAGPASP
jgi:putative PIN family toxin of toxin-antitoxin system